MSSPQIIQKEAEQQAADPGARPAKRRRLSVKWVLVSVLAALLLYSLFDLYWPRSSSLRDFDPKEVARLDTAMWRSYYQRERLKLFNQLSELLRSQYHLPFVRSNAVAYQAARAAFVFKDGRSRAEYERALPNLVSFYESIREVGDVQFDVERAARLELEWWIIHRERKQHPKGELERALAALGAELYRVPAERLMEHARLRAEAMAIRDTRAEEGGVSEADWAKIEELLQASWLSLWQAVNS